MNTCDLLCRRLNFFRSDLFWSLHHVRVPNFVEQHKLRIKLAQQPTTIRSNVLSSFLFFFLIHWMSHHLPQSIVGWMEWLSSICQTMRCNCIVSVFLIMFWCVFCLHFDENKKSHSPSRQVRNSSKRVSFDLIQMEMVLWERETPSSKWVYYIPVLNHYTTGALCSRLISAYIVEVSLLHKNSDFIF